MSVKKEAQMVIIATISFPPESAKEIGKRVLELPPLPKYVTMKGPYVSSDVGVGIKAITVYEFDQSQVRETMELVSNRYVKYYGVPGFTYSIQVWQETAEALKLIGLG